MKSEAAIILCLLAALLEAQAPRKAEASIQMLSSSGYIADCGYLDASGKVKPMDISPDLLTQRFNYSGPARFEIRPVSGPGSKRDASAPLAWFDLPEGPGPHRLILVVNPRPGSNGISAINDEPGVLPFGAIRFLNLCSHPVELSGGRLRMTIKARSSAVLRPNVKDGEYLDLDVVGGEGESRHAFHLRHFHMVDARTLCFIEPEGDNGEFRLKSVEERASRSPNLRLDPSREDPSRPSKEKEPASSR